MVFFRGLMGLLTVSLLSYTSIATAAVKFKTDTTPLTAAATKLFSIDMRTLLSDQGSGNLRWSASADKPAWITIDSPAHRMSGTPALGDVGTRLFRLSVQDDETGAITQIDMKVVIVPIWTQDPIDLGIQNEDVPFTFDLKTKVTHPGGGTLTFSVEVPGSLPSWMTLSPNGVLSGTPRRPDVGTYRDIAFIATTESGGSSKAEAFGEVKKTIHPPKWVGNPLTIDDAFEDKPYSKDVKGLVLNFEGAALTFKLISGPISGWVKLSSSGLLTGTPAKIDIGAVTLRAEVSTVIDGLTFTDVADLKFKVIHTNHSPFWKADPILLPDATTGIAYQQDVSGSAEDPDADKLTFSKIDGPAWISVLPNGKIQGTANKPDVGEAVVTVAVSDGEFAPRTTVRFKVIKANEPPLWTVKPVVLANATEDVAYAAELKPFATDPDADPLSFTLLNGPSWITLGADGKISGTPGASHVGLNKLNVKVSDNIAGSDTTEVQVTVIHTNHAPSWTQDPIRFMTPEERPASFALVPFTTDPDPGDRLTFTKLSGPAWASLDAAGVLSGTPQIPQEGLNTFIIKVADQAGLSSTVTVLVTVLHVNHAPKWSQDPITLPNAKEREPYAQSVASFASDIDPNDTLTFEKLSGPAWVSVGADGAITGTPQRPNLGLNVVKVRVTDAGGDFADVTVNITVDKVNRPPRWTQDPIALGDAFEDKAFAFSLAALAVDDDGDSLTFKIVTGPGWLRATTAGALSGTPGKDDVGNYTARFEVSDGEAAAEADGNGRVIHTNHSPIISTVTPILIKEREVRVESLAPFVTDPDGDPLTFTLIDTADFVTLAPDGKLTLKPVFKDIGQHGLRFRVSDGQFSPEALVTIKVTRDPRPPVWLQDPISFQAALGKPFSSSVADQAKDLDGIAITFTKKAGPAWLTVAANGQLSGTPPESALGENQFTVTVKNDLVGADATVKITVFDPNHAPKWTQNPVVLTDAFEDKAYAFNLAPLATDEDGDALTFKKLEGPDWLIVAFDGKITGTPKKIDLGNFSARFEVSDGKLTAEVQGNGRVLHTNHAPVISAIQTILIKEREIRVEDLALFVNDPDGDALTYSAAGIPAWMTLSPEGKLRLAPLFANIGDHQVTFSVTDGSLSATSTFTLRVIRDPRPPVWLQDPIARRTPMNQPFSESLAVLAKDLDGLPLTFSKTTGPAWLVVSAAGALSGTPLKADLGDNTFTVTVSNDQLGATAKLVITVFDPNQAPRWTVDPVVLPNGPEKVLYSQSLASFAMDPDAGDTLTFSKISGPAWASVSANGTISGTPQRQDVGLNSFRVRVTDPGGLFADAALQITIDFVNQAPKWTVSPVVLNDATEDSPYAFDISPFAVDPDGDKLTFRKVSGPNWLLVAGDGKLSGTPGKADIGDFAAVFEVSDGKLAAQVDTRGKVLHVNHAPALAAIPDIILKEREVRVVELAPFASDPDGDPLAFTLLDPKDFLTLSAAGKLTVKPVFKDIGDHVARVSVSDGKLSATREVKIHVDRDPRPPVWLQDPIRFEAFKGKPFTASVAALAKDLDGIAITFTKASGPAWLTVSPAGALSGTPQKENIGENTFKVTVRNDVLGADATVIITVKDVNEPPVLAVIPLIEMKEREVRAENLAAFASDADGDALTFTIGPVVEWAPMDATGKLTLKPLFAQIGSHTFKLTVSDGKAQASRDFTVKVLRNPRPPVWLEDPIRFEATTGKPFSASVADKAKDLDNLPITFAKTAGPAWLSVSATGQLSGTPAVSDVGENRFTLEVKNDVLGATATVIVLVIKPNQPPAWTQDPIPLGDIPILEAFQFDLAPLAKDPDGDKLTFRIEAGPTWLFASGDGKLTGTPQKKDIGAFTATVIVSDGKLEAKAGVFGKVFNPINHPPQVKPGSLFFVVKERGSLNIELNDPERVSDPDGDPLTFKMEPVPAWVKLSVTGNLDAKPLHAQLGDHTFKLTVTDDKGLTLETALFIRVVPDPQPPIWGEDPIRFTAKVDQNFLQNIGNKVSDPDGLPLQITKGSGPVWLMVSPNGALSGVPRLSDLGENRFQVRASNGTLSSDVMLIITVTKGEPQTDTVQVDKAVPGAPSENLWVVDNVSHVIGQDPLAKSLKANIGAYFQALDAATVKHTGVFLAADVGKWDGNPVKGKTGNWLLKAGDPNLVTDFRYRVDTAEAKECYSSPLWSMFRFYERAPSLPFYHTEAFLPDVPMDVLIVTKRADNFKKHAAGKPQADWTPEQYADNFLAFHAREKKSYRVSAIAAECPKLEDPYHVLDGAESAYQKVVRKTGGAYYPYDCTFEMVKVLKDYAEKVIFRAFVTAKKRILLSKKPLDPKGILVKLGGKVLPGNTGALDDKWFYDAEANEAVFQWFLIDVNALKAGDLIEITYQF